MDINWKRGFVRLWLIISLIWSSSVLLIGYEEIKDKARTIRIFHSVKGDECKSDPFDGIDEDVPVSAPDPSQQSLSFTPKQQEILRKAEERVANMAKTENSGPTSAIDADKNRKPKFVEVDYDSFSPELVKVDYDPFSPEYEEWLEERKKAIAYLRSTRNYHKSLPISYVPCRDLYDEIIIRKNKAYKDLANGAIFLLLPPIVTFAFGASIMWVISGFRRAT